MPVQAQARAQLAHLRRRLQPANAGGPLDGVLDWFALSSATTKGGSADVGVGAGVVRTSAAKPASMAAPAPGGASAPGGAAAPSGASLSAELAPGQITRAEQIKLVRTWPLDKVRDLARGQIQRSKDAFEKASDVPWYTDPYLRLMNHLRWGPSLQMLHDAEDGYAHAGERSTEAEKKESYISAWTTARLALTAIAQEAKFGETSYVYLAEDLGRAVVDAATPYVKQVGQGLEALVWLVLGFGLISAVSK